MIKNNIKLSNRSDIYPEEPSVIEYKAIIDFESMSNFKNHGINKTFD